MAHSLVKSVVQLKSGRLRYSKYMTLLQVHVYGCKQDSSVCMCVCASCASCLVFLLSIWSISTLSSVISHQSLGFVLPSLLPKTA